MMIFLPPQPMAGRVDDYSSAYCRAARAFSRKPAGPWRKFRLRPSPRPRTRATAGSRHPRPPAPSTFTARAAKACGWLRELEGRDPGRGEQRGDADPPSAGTTMSGRAARCRLPGHRGINQPAIAVSAEAASWKRVASSRARRNLTSRGLSAPARCRRRRTLVDPDLEAQQVDPAPHQFIADLHGLVDDVDRRLGDADVLPSDFDILLTPSRPFQQRHGQHDLRLLPVRFLQAAPSAG